VSWRSPSGDAFSITRRKPTTGPAPDVRPGIAGNSGLWRFSWLPVALNRLGVEAPNAQENGAVEPVFSIRGVGHGEGMI